MKYGKEIPRNRGMDVIAEYNDTDYTPGYASPYLPWLTGSRRPLLGAMLDWLSGRSLWDYGCRSSYELKTEYVYANGIVSRSDWSQGYRYSWKDRTEYYHTGFHGSVMMTSGESGLMTERYHYDAFGNNYAGSLAGHNTLGYGGKRYDPATGLYDYGFRDYDTRTGRFTTQDPIRDGTNWYAYCNNDPVNFFDLWGLCAVQDKAANNTNSDNYTDPTGMMDTENDSNSPNSNSAQNNIPDANLSSINIQTPTDPNDYHCDIYAWNQAIENGRDPRGQGGENLNLNEITVNTMFSFFPDGRTNVPNSDTEGYIFYDWDNDNIQDHVEYYSAGTGSDYTVMSTNGIETPTPRTYDSNADSNGRARNGTATFIPLPEL